jgi:M6 family metalloprotease-like protein
MRRSLATATVIACAVAVVSAGPAIVASAAPVTSASALPAATAASSSVGRCKLAKGARIPSNYVQVGFPLPRVRMASRGAVRIAILFVDFPGARSKERTPAALWETLKPAQDFFRTVSYGRMKATLVPHLSWVNMSKPAASYGIRYDGSLTSQGLRAYMQEAVTRADPKVNFKGIDAIVVASTPQAGSIEYSPAFVAPSTSSGLQTREGSIANGSLAAADTWGEWGYGWRILPHELGHAMGLADLYDGYGDSRFGQHGYVGIWDLMGDPASPTPEYNAWNRWLLGWINDRSIVCASTAKSTTATLNAVGMRGGTKALIVPLSSTRAVVVESRRPTRYDGAEYLGSPIKPGALVYVVDTSVATLRGPMRVVPAERGSPIFGLATAPLGVGDKVTTDGLRISVLSSTARGDTVRVERLR